MSLLVRRSFESMDAGFFHGGLGISRSSFCLTILGAIIVLLLSVFSETKKLHVC